MKCFPILALALALLTLPGCGPSGQPEAAVEEKPVIAEDGTWQLILRADDRMNFDKTTLRAKAGVPIRLELIHTGRAPKSAMGHNVVILKSGVDHARFAQKAALASTTDFIPAAEAESVIAHTRMIGGGERDSVEFTIAEPGTYVFLCSFPAHYARMRGQLIIE